MAVYTEVSDEALDAFLAAYDIGSAVAFRGIAEGVENSNFSLKTSSGDYILTLYEKRVDPAELPWFIGLMEHLAARGIACPLPVAARDGQALRRLCGRHAAITTFLPGIWPRHVRIEHCHQVGAALARLHLAGDAYTPTRVNALSPPRLGPLLERCRARGDDVWPGLVAELDETLALVARGWPGGLARGHIHADLFPDNVFFLDGQLSGLIDFYFAATDLLAYDIAVCLNAWCFDEACALVPAQSAALLRGYETVRPLEAAERAALPVLSQGAALRFCMTRLHDWLHHQEGALVTPKDPLDYLRRLRVHRGIATASAYGA